MKDFFISYNSADKQWAEWIGWILEEADYTTIIQSWDFKPGNNFILEMDNAVQNATKVIAVLSDNYLKAVYTAPEWAFALSKDPQGYKRLLIPVRIQTCDPRGFFKTTIYADLVGLTEIQSQQTLLNAVQDERNKPKKKPHYPDKLSPTKDQSPFPGEGSRSINTWIEKYNHFKNQNLDFECLEESNFICDQLGDIKSNLINLLFENNDKSLRYVFGYFCYEVDGFERVLLRCHDDMKWSFPISFFCMPGRELREEISDKVREFLQNTPGASIDSLLKSTFEGIEISEITNSLEIDCIPIDPIFVKIKVLNRFTSFLNHKWRIKAKYFPKTDKNNEDQKSKLLANCNEPELLSLITNDRIIKELDVPILECVDIIVFRETKNEQREFLLLRRNDNDKWEYPKGGLFFHETIQEGGVRELLEETGLSTMADFRYGGSLGFQTVDVKKRNKPYKVVRVFGITYLYMGDESSRTKGRIKLSSEHKDFKWASISEAKKVWMEKKYGKEFFRRWDRSYWKIRTLLSKPTSLAFQVTEKCVTNCRFCLRRSQKEGFISFDKGRQIIDLLSHRGVRRLTFTGGEPLLIGKKNLFELVKYANKNRIHTCLSTTGIGPSTNKNLSLTWDDIKKLNDYLDQFLLPVHCLKEDIAKKMFANIDKSWKPIMNKVQEIIEWSDETKIKIEIATVVSEINYSELKDIGKWIIKNSEKWKHKDPKTDLIWKLDEYYVNGKQVRDLSNNSFILKSRKINEIYQEISHHFSDYFKSISFSSAVSRASAPDVMVTPLGNIVTSRNHQYRKKGDISALQFYQFVNRRSWRHYELSCRTDWHWYNPLHATIEG